MRRQFWIVHRALIEMPVLMALIFEFAPARALTPNWPVSMMIEAAPREVWAAIFMAFYAFAEYGFRSSRQNVRVSSIAALAVLHISLALFWLAAGSWWNIGTGFYIIFAKAAGQLLFQDAKS